MENPRHMAEYPIDRSLARFKAQMPPATQDLRYPNTAHADWDPVSRFLVLGPVTGALVGYAQVTVAAAFWLHYGEPDFYFRGASGVSVSYLLVTIGGIAAGLVYGGILLMFEHFTRRRIRPLVSLGLVLITASGISAGVVAVEFQQRKMRWPFLEQSSAVAVGLLISMASSTRRKIESSGPY